MFKKIKEIFKRKEKISKYIDYGILSMGDGSGHGDFLYLAKLAHDQKVKFRAVFTTELAYSRIYSDLKQGGLLFSDKGKIQHDVGLYNSKGIQTLVGLRDPYAKNNVRVFTVLPEKLQKPDML